MAIGVVGGDITPEVVTTQSNCIEKDVPATRLVSGTVEI